MKAAVIKNPGNIVVEEFISPIPGEGEVLLKVDACAICGTDQRVLKGEKPVDVPIVGHEISGTVAGLGKGVSGFKEGERYAVQTVIGCGDCPMCAISRENLCENGFKAIGYQWNGGFAEYMIMPKVGVDQGCLIPVSDKMTDEEATILEPLSCCINGMRIIPLEDAQSVIVFGGGIIGVLNGLVAKARGAKSVTIIDVSQDRLELLASLNLPFDHYVNSATTSPEEWVKENTNGRGVDVVVVAASVKSLVKQGMDLLARDGHLSIFAGMPKSDPTDVLDLNLIHYPELHIHGANSSVKRDYIEAEQMISSGLIDASALVTHVFSLDEFNEAVNIQSNPKSGALKVIIRP
ncbi:alcohol dehydrogenase catalytic domain-containing protein [Carboxylicivirga sp. RSCT41]|uniref:alcohol dehydrogenase catalytic domain-containing protein n=1 Tax=Carboxylicivirga agarovorans TaxID=3417570 RepID=UPI003D3587AF